MKARKRKEEEAVEYESNKGYGLCKKMDEDHTKSMQAIEEELEQGT